MIIPKRHHYVPRFFLANFVDGAGKLWVRRASGGPVWSAAPEDVYVERHRYSSIDETGNRNPELEREYSVLEGAAKPVIDKLLAAGRNKRPPALEVSEKAVWNEFLYHQMKRVPAVTAALVKKQSWSERLEDALQKLLDGGVSIDQETADDLRSRNSLARLSQNATVKALSADSPLVRVMLGAATVELGVAPPGTSFIISSHPIAGFRAGLQSAMSAASEMWLPIASDVAARLTFGEEPRTVELLAEKVSKINLDSSAQGEFLAGASQELVEAVPCIVIDAAATSCC